MQPGRALSQQSRPFLDGLAGEGDMVEGLHGQGRARVDLAVGSPLWSVGVVRSRVSASEVMKSAISICSKPAVYTEFLEVKEDRRVS